MSAVTSHVESRAEIDETPLVCPAALGDPAADAICVPEPEAAHSGLLSFAWARRTAEELIFVDPTTGAANDIEKATAIARKMVMEYGMSDRLGPMQYGHANGEVFLGRDYGRQQDYSDEVASFIDAEVRKLISQAHEEARQILSTHRDALDRMASVLIERETIDAEEVAEVFATVPKWEHAETGSMRIQIPNGRTNATPDTVVPDGIAAVGEPGS
ncbi:MAG: hypothetical protein RI637_08565 [Acidimicrobiia bacterium]|nr:hypothetical protein [Acidimicrobiia bacterium]